MQEMRVQAMQATLLGNRLRRLKHRQHAGEEEKGRRELSKIVAKLGRAEAQLVGKELTGAEQRLERLQREEQSQQALVDRLRIEISDTYASAATAITRGDTDTARRHMQDRTRLMKQRVQEVNELQEATARVAAMRLEVEALAERAAHVEQATSLGEARSILCENAAATQ